MLPLARFARLNCSFLHLINMGCYKTTKVKFRRPVINSGVKKNKLMKKQILRILLGVITSVAIMAILFYFFIFFNPFDIYESQTLKWIPILIVGISLYVSGRINRNTSVKLLPILFIPLIILRLFNFTYFPFIIAILIVAILVLVTTRKELSLKYRKLSWVAIVGIFGYFLFAQPLILEEEGFGYNDEGDLINANVLWEFNEKKELKLPSHVLLTKDNELLILKMLQEKHTLSNSGPPGVHRALKINLNWKDLKKNLKTILKLSS